MSAAHETRSSPRWGTDFILAAREEIRIEVAGVEVARLCPLEGETVTVRITEAGEVERQNAERNRNPAETEAALQVRPSRS